MEKENTCKVAIDFRFIITNRSNSKAASFGELTILTKIKPCLLFYKLSKNESSNLIEQNAIDRVRELIKVPEDARLNVEILSVRLV